MFRRAFLRYNRWSYKYLAKPLLFKIPPDKTHSDMIALTSWGGKYAFFRALVGFLFKGKDDKSLAQKICGVDFKRPVGVSAGFDKNGEVIPMMSRLGFGFMEIGSVTAKKCAGNPRPWFYRLPNSQSLVVHAGLANEGSEGVLGRVRAYSDKSIGNFPVILSVAKTNCKEVVSVAEGIDDYVKTITRAKSEPRIKMIEINISCPNTYGGEPFTDPEKLTRLLKAVNKIGIKKPIFLKMPVDLKWSDFKKLLDVAVLYKISGVTIANLTKDRSIVNKLDNLPDTVLGGMSGKLTEDIGNELIRQTYLNYGDNLKIIGVGGIFTAEDAYKKIRLGASLVEIISGLIYCGPQLAAEINEGVSRFLKRDGFAHISEAVGVDARKL
jgi:dihydroorotate dehydrogenase (fumarate)